MDWVVKLQKHGGQYRITIPKELIAKADLENARMIKLEAFAGDRIVIREYYGKWKEKRDISENRS